MAAETKYLLLSDGSIDDVELKGLTQAAIVTFFDYKTHGHWRLDELMARCQTLVVDISDVESKRYFLQQKGQIQQSWRVIYRLKPGKSFTPTKMAELKLAFAASVCIKHLPEFLPVRGVADYFSRLLASDHIPTGGCGAAIKQCLGV